MFKKSYAVRFVNVRVADIVEDVMTSNILAAICKVSYRRYDKLGTRIIKHQGVLSILARLGRDAPEAKIPGITHLDNPWLYEYSQKDILFIIPADDPSARNDQKPVSLQTNSFYIHSKPFKLTV